TYLLRFPVAVSPAAIIDHLDRCLAWPQQLLEQHRDQRFDQLLSTTRPATDQPCAQSTPQRPGAADWYSVYVIWRPRGGRRLPAWRPAHVGCAQTRGRSFSQVALQKPKPGDNWRPGFYYGFDQRRPGQCRRSRCCLSGAGPADRSVYTVLAVQFFAE